MPNPVADAIRALSDEALTTLLDCAEWADAEGHLPEIAQSQEAHDEITALIAKVEG